ncbi:MAG: DUF5133 domain-containing protein [Streptomyces sp.]|uniref:DUF5133 domain-containing protein n=1 Tax=Streptomyces sp. TaxID=1931 RepID=UPI0025EE63B7|nr:DUF5133 domain-containing protein [Streptomyces sp.]MBW8792370.1 DUF5133 domain-containing protein [Streptomyces sp.]
MITPPPQTLRALLARYAEACVRMLEADTAARRRVVQDTAYTLCVATGTCDIKDALAEADRLLAEGRSDASVRRPGAGRDQAGQTLVA